MSHLNQAVATDYALSAYLREEGIVETDPGTAPS